MAEKRTLYAVVDKWGYLVNGTYELDRAEAAVSRGEAAFFEETTYDRWQKCWHGDRRWAEEVEDDYNI